MSSPLVGIIMGSASDMPVMNDAVKILDELKIPNEISVISAHRTPHLLIDYATKAVGRGIKVIIAGAGGAAHLPGVTAAFTPLPIIGVPIKSSNSLDGWDSILSILQMPSGVPVATVALNAAKNAGILAASILSAFDESIAEKIQIFKQTMEKEVGEKIARLKKDGWE